MFFVFFIFCINEKSIAQEEDDFDDFDPSMFQEASTSLKAFCTNKVLGQSPTQLISLSYDMQGPSTLIIPETKVGGGNGIEEVEWEYSPGFRFNSNVPIISKNNVLVNWSLNYVQFGYIKSSDQMLTNALGRTLDQNSLKWLNTSLTLFKPLNDRHFLLFQLGAELNGDYDFNNLPKLEKTRIPAAALFGFKPSDRLMWGFGASRTYLGGALNYIPVIYYYQTFKNEKWGIEALLPGRAQVRYRTNSRNVFMLGFNVEGATYHLSNFYSNNITRQDQSLADRYFNVELRRSEIRTGLTYQRGLNDFIWIGASAGYRINYSYELDEGDFYRGFDDSDYLLEPELSNTPYFQISLSLVSP